MSESQDRLEPERLVEAAEASLRAAVESSELTGGTWPYPADLMGGPMQPECLAPFSKWEIQQACQFLVRMGILESPRRRAA